MNQLIKKRFFKTALWTLSTIIVVGAATLLYVRKTVLNPFEIDKTIYIYIDSTKNFDQVVDELKKKVELPSEELFRVLSDKMHYTSNLKTGRYAVKKGMTMLQLIRALRAGNQAPVNLTFNNMRLKENLARRIGEQLMMDSTILLASLNDEKTVHKLGFNKNTVVALFIPNTYQVYWNISIDRLLSRMKREYESFWDESRKAKARKVSLSPVQVSILASIVEEESTYTDEYPIVAGLYLNRLKRGQKLEADPTVKFAVGNFGLRRILFKHLDTSSPYNTYLHSGLPPGPIRIPSIKAIDAVLSPMQHNYYFMCAKDDLSGRHNFATTLTEHNRNAARYRAALNARRIY